MNKKGFTLVELLATLVILGIVTGLVVVGVNYNIKNTKEKTEEVFIGTIKDALKVYIDSDAKNLTFKSSAEGCIDKSLKSNVKVYMVNSAVSLTTVVNSKYSPLDIKDLVNPNNEKVNCNVTSRIVYIYRDEDYVYYYKIAKSSLSCLTTSGNITNLPTLKTCS